MGKYGKWITGGLGWVLFGPIGGILGFALGSLFSNAEVEAPPVYTGQTSRNSFLISLLVLVSAVLKADGKVMKSELDYVKLYFRQNFGDSASHEAILLLRDLLKQNISLKEVCSQICQNSDYSERLQLIHLLFGIAQADASVSANELRVIGQISTNFGLTQADFDSIKSMFIHDTNKYYQILEIPTTATDEEVKKAYRRMAVRYHPDKVSHLGEDIRLQAEQKFKMVAEAYENIKKERGIN